MQFDAAHAFYLLALMLMLSAGLFAAYRDRFGTMLQHAAIWALIFAGVVIAYGFREVLTAQLSPAPVLTVSGNAVALSRDGSGHFRARAQVNGATVDFLVDTGATSVVLSRRDAERAGIDPETLVFATPAQTANGVIYSARTMVDTLRIGPFEDRDVAVMVNGGDLSTSLLGMSYLGRFARVTVEGERMLLER